LLFVLGGCSMPAVAEPDPRAWLAPIEERLRAARELEFVTEVPVARADRETVARMIEAHLREFGGERLDDLSAAYAKLGLLPPGADLRSGLLGFYSTRTLAFYDSKAKGIAISEDRPGGALSAQGERALVHELAHALQDQRFSVGERLAVLDARDRALALRAVAEGDAILTEHAYVFGGANEALLQYAFGLLGGGVEELALSGVPALVCDQAAFEYGSGARFVLRALAKHGWRGVDLLYRHPPLSTEQVLHPEKYFEAPDPPTRIGLEGLAELFPEGWKEVTRDTLGELAVRSLFKEILPAGRAEEVGRGWDGDLFVAYRSGEEIAFVWATVWDSPADALEFLGASQELFAKKQRDRGADPERFYVEQRGATVLLIEGLDRGKLERDVEAIWRGMRLEEEAFAAPPALAPAAAPPPTGSR
jgi:hypothetical protein